VAAFFATSVANALPMAVFTSSSSNSWKYKEDFLFQNSLKIYVQMNISKF
jgi:hypothetical protein